MTKDELFSQKITEPDEAVYFQAKERWDSIAKPVDSMGEFEDIICRIASVQGKREIDIAKKALIIMCSDNGVVEEGVSQTGSDVTYKVASLMGKRMSSVGIMTKDQAVDIFTYDVGIDSDDTPEGVINKKISKGTANFLKQKAMSEEECLGAITVGIDAVKECARNGYGMIATGEMGIGNTTTTTALLCALTGHDPAECTGRGAGLSDEGLKRKIEVIKEGLRIHAHPGKITSPDEVFDILTSLGGLDIAALTGVFIGCAICHIPAVIDGVISAVAAFCAERFLPGCSRFMIGSHMGKENGVRIILNELSIKSVINAKMALGEGTGAVMIFPLLDMAASLYLSGTSFDETPIEKYERFEEE